MNDMQVKRSALTGLLNCFCSFDRFLRMLSLLGIKLIPENGDIFAKLLFGPKSILLKFEKSGWHPHSFDTLHLPSLQVGPGGLEFSELIFKTLLGKILCFTLQLAGS